MKRGIHVRTHMHGRVNDLKREHFTVGNFISGGDTLAFVKTFLTPWLLIHHHPIEMLNPCLMSDTFNGSRMSFTQRFRYNEMAQRYAIYSDLWRKKSRIREEGYRRPQDALLSVQGVRPAEEHEPQHPTPYAVGHTGAAVAPAGQKRPFAVQCSDPTQEQDKIQSLFHALVEAKKKNGESLKDTANFDSFTTFVKKKTDQIRKQSGCPAVEYTVEMQDGQVKLKAKAKT